MDQSKINVMKMGADVDQAIAGLIEMSRTLGNYRNALMEQGFKRDEALAIVSQYHMTILAHIFGQQKGPSHG